MTAVLRLVSHAGFMSNGSAAANSLSDVALVHRRLHEAEIDGMVGYLADYAGHL